MKSKGKEIGSLKSCFVYIIVIFLEENTFLFVT